MYSRRFDVAVVLLWLSTMSWLIAEKVVPALLVGDPPNYRNILETQRDEPPLCWTMLWNERRLGWACSTTTQTADGLTEVFSRVHFDELPLRELVPNWFASLLPPLEKLQAFLEMENRSKLVFDTAGRLRRFESSIQFEPGASAVKVQGTIEGVLMSVNVQTGDFYNYETEMTLPRKATLNDTFTPQTRLPGLREGQTWTMEVYSPLQPPTPGRDSRMEILLVRVEGTVLMEWEGQTLDVWMVTYRDDPGEGLGNADKPRGRLWVHGDGTVLKQQVNIFDHTMTFLRLPDAEAAALAERADDIWQLQEMTLPASEPLQ